jgi:hypothetical protein
MVRAALHAGLGPRQLSFTGAVQALNGFVPAFVLAEESVQHALLDALWVSVAAHRVGKRPNRVEPRAVKRRPKAHRRLPWIIAHLFSSPAKIVYTFTKVVTLITL